MYKKDDLVIVTNNTSQYHHKVGRVAIDQTSEGFVEVLLELPGLKQVSFHPSNVGPVRKAGEYRPGDVVKIINSLSSQQNGKTGVVVPGNGLMSGSVNVKLEGDRSAGGVHFTSLVLVEAAPKPSGYRAKGEKIASEDVRMGDVISVKSVIEYADGFSSTSETSGVVASIGDSAIFTSDGRVLWNTFAPRQTITLVEPIKDQLAEDLMEMKIDTVLSWNYGKAGRVAVGVKVDKNKWHMVGATGPQSVSGDRIREYLLTAGDSYTILDGGLDTPMAVI